MERAIHFKLKDGSRYAGMFPTATGKNTTVDRNADLSKTLIVLPGVVKDYNWQAAKIAKALQGNTLEQCAKNIWEFCYWYFQYHLDKPNTEQIRTPSRSWADREAGIDCDCFSVLVGSILTNMTDPQTGQKGIPYGFRIAKYHDPLRPNPPFQHIYVYVPHGQGQLIIDPVMNRFNFEEPFIEKIDLNMELQILNGVPGSNGPQSIDQMEMFPVGSLPRGAKLARLKQEAAAKGMTLEAYLAWKAQQFQNENGVSQTDYVQQAQDQMNQHLANSQAAEEQVLAKLKAELTRRGIAFPPNANRDQLLALIRGNPKASVPSKIIHTINKASPGATLLRQGLLIGMKTNLMKVAEKMRWALISPSQAIAAGMTSADHQKLLKSWKSLKKIHFNAGGKIEKLAGAILTGKGNADKSVALSGLGEPITAGAAIAAATAALGTIAAILKNIKTPSKVSGQAFQIDPLSLSTTGIDMAVDPDTGQAVNQGNSPEEKGVWNWIKSHPIPVAGIGIAVVGAGFGIAHLARSKDKPTAKPKARKPALAGTKRPKSRHKNGRFKRVHIT